MADESKQGDGKQPQPTASEALFFYSIVKNMKALTDIDWAAVAEDRGFKNAEVAKVRFGQVKRKLGIQTDPNKANPGVKATPKKAAGIGIGATPSKVTKTPASRSGTKGKKGGRVKKEEAQDEDNGDSMDDTPTKKEPKPEGGVKHETMQDHIDAMLAGADPF